MQYFSGVMGYFFGPLGNLFQGSLAIFFGPGSQKNQGPMAFFTWVGDSVGGSLGGKKAYQALALQQCPDKMKCSMKAVFKVFIFWTITFSFSGSPEHPTGVLKAMLFPRKMAPGFSRGAERPTVVCLLEKS